MSVHEVLEQRYWELEAYLCKKYKLERQEVLDDVFVKTVGKIIRLAHRHDPKKSSAWSWMKLIGRGVAWQVLDRLDKKPGTHSRYPVDMYTRGERESLEYEYSLDEELVYNHVLRDLNTPESILMAKQLVEQCAGTRGTASTRKRVVCRVYKSVRGA